MVQFLMQGSPAGVHERVTRIWRVLQVRTASAVVLWTHLRMLDDFKTMAMRIAALVACQHVGQLVR